MVCFWVFGFLVFWYREVGGGWWVVEVGADAMRRARVRRMLWSLYIYGYVCMCFFGCRPQAIIASFFLNRERTLRFAARIGVSKQRPSKQAARRVSNSDSDNNVGMLYLQIQYREMH